MYDVDKSLTLNKLKPTTISNNFLKKLNNRLYFYYKQTK